jgi:lipid-binding SYLF domain-containing protein
MWKQYVVAALALGACATKAPNAATQRNLEQQSTAALSEMEQRSPGITQMANDAAGYIILPNVGAGGYILAGGAFGRGILFERGTPTGYVELKQASVGPQLGGQTYAELIILRDQAALDRVKGGKFSVGGDVGVVVLTAGAAGGTQFNENTSVFVMPHGGLMAQLTVSGQKIDFRPLG